MSTTRQRAANAANAQHSTGPQSQDAKAAVRFNATKYGLTSKLVVIPGEDPEAFDSLKADLTTSYHPANLAEQFLVEQIAENLWRLLRARGIETATFQANMAPLENSNRIFNQRCPERPPADGTIAAAQCFNENAKTFDNLRRYETAIERAYYRAIDHLVKLQKERRATEEKQTPNPEIGIVSQKPAPDPIQALVYRASAAVQPPTIIVPAVPAPKTQLTEPNLVPSHR
jgi:hypothetical protein